MKQIVRRAGTRRSRVIVSTAAAAAAAVTGTWAPVARAQSFTFDPGKNGAQVWDTSTLNWDNGTNTPGTYDDAFVNGLSANSVIALLNSNAATTITTAVPITLNQIQFTGANANTIVAGTSANAITLAGTGTNTIDVVTGGTGTISGVLAGTTGLTKTGSGTLVLSGTNLYTGGTTISGGTVSVAAVGNLSTGAVQINGGTLQSTAAITFSQAITIGASGGTFDQNAKQKSQIASLAGTGTFTRSASANGTTRGAGAGAGVTNDLQLTGTATFNGPVVLNGGQTEGSTATIGTGAITINSGAELSGSYSNAITINTGGSISAIGGTSTFSGPITVGGNFTVGLGDFYQSVNRNLIISGNISGAGTITPLNAATTTAAAGAGQTLFLNGNNTGYTSAISVPAGYTFSFGTANSYGTGGVTVTSTSTALGGIGVGYVPASQAALPTLTANNTSTFGGVFQINTAGFTTALDLATLYGSSTTPTGGTNGTWFLGSGSTGTYAAATLGASGGTYRLGGGFGALTLSAANVLTGANAVVVGSAAAGTNGTGTIILGAANDYTGATTITAGSTLQVNDGGALGSVATGTTINGGGSLALSGGITVNEPLTGSGNSSTGSTTNLANAIVNVAGTNTLAGTLAVNVTSGNFRVSTNTGTTLNVSGNVTLSGTPITNGLVFAGAGTVNQTGTISGPAMLYSTSTGTSTLSGTNTFTGKVQIQQGTFSTPSLNNIGTNGLTPLAASGLGAPTTAATAVIEFGNGTTGGTLSYTGTGETTDRQVVLLGTTGGATISQSGTGVLKFLTNINASGAGIKTLTLQGSTAGTGEFAGVISNNSATNVTNVTKTGTGTWTLSGANTYSGPTSVNQGTLIISSLANVNAGTATSLGNPTTVAQGTIKLGSGTTTSVAGMLVYTGTGSTSDRVIDLASNTANGTLDQSGTGTFQVGAVTATGAGTKALVLQGSTAGVGVVAGAIANNSSTNLTNVTKAGTGTWTLAGTNTYTGTTTVNAGLLRVTGNSSAATGAVAVNTGGSLGGTGTVGGAVTVAAGGNFDLRDAGVGTLTLGSTLALNGTAALSNNLYFDLGNGAGTVDRIAATGAVTTANANAVLVSFNQLSGTPLQDGTYTLISTAAATGNTTTGFALATTQSGGHTYALTTAATGNVLQVTVGTAAAGVANAVWGGTTANATWTTAGNWYTDVASGTPTGAVPGVGSNVTFYTTNPAASNLSTVTLGADFEINSLTFPSTATAAVTIGGAANALTIDAGTANGNAAGNGITQSAAQTHTIAARVGIGAAQTWTVAAGGGLTVSGLVFDTGPGFALTKAGAGTLTLSGTANTFTGDINVTGGVLAFAGNAGANGDPLSLGAGNKAITVTNNAVLRPTSSANPTSTNTKRFVVGAGGATFDPQAGVTFTLDDATQFGGTGDLTVTSSSATPSGVVYLHNQAFNFSGNVTVNSGTLRLGTNAVLGTSPGRTITVNAGGTLDTNNTVTAANVPLGVTLNGGTLSAATANGSFAQAVTLTAASNVSAGTGFTETVAGNVAGPFALTKVGAGTTVLSGTNTYAAATGASTIVTAGTLTAAKTAALPGYATAGQVSVASGALLNLNVGGTGEFTPADVTAVLAGGTFASGSGIGFDTTNAGGSFTAPAVTPTPAVAALNLQKAGAGTLVLPNPNGFGTGSTTILAGTVSATSGTLNPLGTGFLTLGTVGGADNALNLGTSSQSFSGLRVNNSSATTASTITVAAGQTLTFTGNVLVGPDAPTATLPSKLTVTGGGNLAVTTAAGGLFLVGGTNASTTSGQVLDNATLDLTGLASANINVSATGSVRVANQMNANTAGVQATLLLPTPTVAAGTAVTTVLANNFNVGDSGSNGTGAGQVNSIVLGTGLTTLNVNNLNVGTGNRDLGTLTFAPGNGTLTLQGAASTPTSRTRAAINVGTGGANTGVAPGTGVTNVLDLSGHNADLFVSTVTIGSQNRLTNRTDTVTFDTGTLDATTVVVGTNFGATSTAAGTFTPTWTSTLNLAGGTTTIGTGGLDIGFGQTAATSGSQLGTKTITANVNVSGGAVTVANNTTFGAAIRMSQSTQSSVVADSNLTVTGGTLSVSGNIIKGLSTGAGTATLTLNGGTLNMNGKAIGSGTAAVATVFAAGTLDAVASINGTGGLTKTTGGTLALTGTNTYTGATTVNDGTLLVGTPTAIGSVTSAVSVVTATATVGGNGSIAGPVAVSAGTLSPGANGPGVLTVGGAVSLAAGSVYRAEVAGVVPATAGNTAVGYDQTVSTASGANTISIDGSRLVALGAFNYAATPADPGNPDPTRAAYILVQPGTSPVVGTFAGLPTDGSTVVFADGGGTAQITYTANFEAGTLTGGNDVALYNVNLVPEPGTAALAAVGAGLLALRRRRRPARA